MVGAMPEKPASQDLPSTSLRAHPPEQPPGLAGDESGETAISTIMGLVIGFLFINLIAVLLFTQIGIDSTEICGDPTNFTAEDCASAESQRGWFWTILVIVDVVILLVLLGVAKKQAKF